MSQKLAIKKDILLRKLINLGLSADEAVSYVVLSREGSLTITALAHKVGVLPNAVYRLAAKLEEKDFIKILDTYPVTLQPSPPEFAIDSFIGKKIRELEDQKTTTKELMSQDRTNTPTKVDVLVSQKIYFDKFIELAQGATQEILVISIGEPVPDDIKIACVQALARKVSVRFIFHEYGKHNANLVSAWIKMGVEVRHHKDEGYHLNIFVAKVAVLVANNPKNTNERTGMVFYSERLSNSLKEYFYTLWNSAIPLKE